MLMRMGVALCACGPAVDWGLRSVRKAGTSRRGIVGDAPGSAEQHAWQSECIEFSAIEMTRGMRHMKSTTTDHSDASLRLSPL
ncbi:hypothetical protein ACFPRL_23615 [Pseudoclavibacter helvolus]